MTTDLQLGLDGLTLSNDYLLFRICCIPPSYTVCDFLTASMTFLARHVVVYRCQGYDEGVLLQLSDLEELCECIHEVINGNPEGLQDETRVWVGYWCLLPSDPA